MNFFRVEWLLIEFYFSGWMDVIPLNIETLESMMVSSYKCYDTALQLETSDAEKRNLLVRLGNIHNELGVLYMNYAGCKNIFYT